MCEFEPGSAVALPHAAGSWGTCIESLNLLIEVVGWRTQEVARIINDVALGDLSRKMALEFEGNQLRGDHLKVASAINQLVDRLRIVSSTASGAEVMSAKIVWPGGSSNVFRKAGDASR